MQVVSELLCGRFERGPPLQIPVSVASNRKSVVRRREATILLQVLMPFAALLPLATNDLFDPEASPAVATLPSYLHRLVSIWHIPLIKRATTTYSQICFMGLFSYVALKPPCGDLDGSHWVYLVWVCALALQEAQQAALDFEMWRRNRYNKMDVLIIVLLGTAAWLRFLLIEPPEETHFDLIDFVYSHAEHHVPRTNGHEDERPLVPLADYGLCPWSLEVELLRTTLATLSVMLAVRRLLLINDYF